MQPRLTCQHMQHPSPVAAFTPSLSCTDERKRSTSTRCNFSDVPSLSKNILHSSDNSYRFSISSHRLYRCIERIIEPKQVLLNTGSRIRVPGSLYHSAPRHTAINVSAGLLAKRTRALFLWALLCGDLYLGLRCIDDFQRKNTTRRLVQTP